MKHVSYAFIAVISMFAVPCHAEDARPLYQWMIALAGDWALSPVSAQEGKATQHPLVSPLLGTQDTAIRFSLVGKGSTVQENLLPGTQKEMVTMYHCQDIGCARLKATHYCVKQNQPEMFASPASKSNRLTFNCDMGTALCQSDQDHVHSIDHELSADGTHLKTTYTSWKDGKHFKDSVYHFDRR